MEDKAISKMIDDFLKVSKVVKKDKMEFGKEYIYECPICGGELHALKNSYNGHLHIFCNKCKYTLME